MYFSLISLRKDTKSLEFWQVFRSLYDLHQSIWKMFGDYPNRKRDFLYRLEQEGKEPVIYAVSSRKPFLNSDIWYVSTKEYKPKIRAGMNLAFMLRANPILTKRDESGKQHRHDVVMEAKINLRKQGVQGSKPLAVIVQEEGNKWLLSRAEKYGFTINPEHIRVDGYRQRRFFKRKQDKPVSFTTMDFNGILTVIEPESFIKKALYEGIGPAKGFGCGMMMVRRTNYATTP